MRPPPLRGPVWGCVWGAVGGAIMGRRRRVWGSVSPGSVEGTSTKLMSGGPWSLVPCFLSAHGLGGVQHVQVTSLEGGCPVAPSGGGAHIRRLQRAEHERAREQYMSLQPSGKRPRLLPGTDCPAVLLSGDDGVLPDDEAQAWRDQLTRLSSNAQQLFFDRSFPAAHISIKGKDEPPPSDQPPSRPGQPPTCNCHAVAAKATVQRDTPNKGKEYWHCQTRKCGFFAWVDGSENAFKRDGSATRLQWARLPPQLHIVNDFGFRAEDLRQGGVGDCWFMSALAVVAQRHDLIAKLFVDTARNRAGCCCLRLFMDGEWKSIEIDDLLPVTSQPRRENLAFETKLAFCRCGSATGEQQLWASLVEKAYAKCHGSYQAISGGQVAEALLDLTGAPTEMIYLGDDQFDSEWMWARLKAYVRLGFPMGCGTNNAEGSESLKEVGLVGGHAYSILNVREAMTKQGGVVRLLRVRNPHGCTEWNGEWSDASDAWAQLLGSDDNCRGHANGGGGGSTSADALPLCPYGAACYRQHPQHRAEYRHHALPSDHAAANAAGFERTGVDDGTFWMDYTKVCPSLWIRAISLLSPRHPCYHIRMSWLTRAWTALRSSSWASRTWTCALPSSTGTPSRSPTTSPATGRQRCACAPNASRCARRRPSRVRSWSWLSSQPSAARGAGPTAKRATGWVTSQSSSDD